MALPRLPCKPTLDERSRHLNEEKIKVEVTDSGKTMDVVVLNKRAPVIQIVLGEGVHSVKCDLAPTRNGQTYVGTAIGRELV